MRDDIAALMNGQRALRTELEASTVEAHQQIHAAQSLKNESLDRRISSLDDILALPETPRPKQMDQGDLLRAYLSANGDLWYPAKDIRRKMNMRSDDFSRLLKTLKGVVESKKNPEDGREILIKIV